MNKGFDSQKIGSVLVVGGGIAGIQSALDLAEQGYYVYLVEKSPAIGGVMAQLDKTFPTNDCSMCILAPKLVECGRHLNIETMTWSEVLDVSGEEGNFKVKVKKKARYIDLNKCTGCGECTDVCPVEIESEFDERLVNKKAIFRPFPQAYPNAFTIEKDIRPCQIACPAGVHVQGYIALIKQKKYEEALSLIKKNNPLPAICGRICPHPCEAECRRRLVDEPVAINSLKRFITDYEMQRSDDRGQTTEVRSQRSEELVTHKVAIIGSGPAGLSCAYYLSQQGYKVTIFEALPVLGGMLRVGIPEYRLPKDILNKEIESILNLGVEVKTNVKIGKDLTMGNIFKQGYKAIFIGTGAHRSLKLNIPNEDSKGVVPGIDFLRDLNLGKKVKVGKNVVIIGGGNVAIDTARSSLRLGAEKVTILYRRSRKEMPASPGEVEEAEKEGVKIKFLVAPVEVLTRNNKVVSLRCIKMQLGAPDASGRRRPIPISGSEFNLSIDMIIPAIGQAPDTSYFKEYGIGVAKRRTIQIDEDTLLTSKDGVFAGGDTVLGPATAVEAIAQGRKAAQSIIAYIKGRKAAQSIIAYIKGEKEVELQAKKDYGELPPNTPLKKRQKIKTLPVGARKSNFKEVELGLTEKQALKEAERCLSCGICSECLQCEEACKAEAIVHQDIDKIIELDVGSIILAPGFDEFDPTSLYEYGYKKYKNVVTSIEFERILSATGPYQGEVIRPSDRKIPERIAFIQCVGSRDEKTNPYCSSVCCTYAIKEAIIAREHTAGKIEATIFFMDLRCYGKNFDKYYERAKDEYKVKFVRSKIYKIEELNGTGDLSIIYAKEDGKKCTERFDLVILSVGFQPPVDAVNLARKVGLNLNKYNFIQTRDFEPVKTSKEGIYVCGAFSGPKDIPETVMQASGAAAEASCLLSDVRGTQIKEKVYPPEIDVTGQEPRIGVFICHCGINIGGYVDVPKVTEFAKTLPNVIYAENNLYTCSQDTQERIKEMIKEHNLNRVVVASCSPSTHEPLFQETIREAGLNKYLFEMANIRNQCSWVHMDEPEKATEKAKDLVKMAIAKARLIESLKELELDLTKSALVIGGGISGMTATLNLAKQGFKVYLIEKNSELGGIARRIKWTNEGLNVQNYLKSLIDKVTNNKNIEIITEATIVEVSGYVGNFKTGFMRAGRGYVEEINSGVIIVAAGAKEYKPDEYMYGQDDRVITQLELEEKLLTPHSAFRIPQSVVMIQCVGSRNGERPYCSRFCCMQAVKNALKIKEISPDTEIYILYRDIRTYGFNEDYYREAREKGIMFIRYDEEKKPVISHQSLNVKIYDEILGREIEIPADLIVLSVGVEPYQENKELATLLKVPLNEDNFFLEAHVKLRPVDFATEGIFVCGLCHSPKSIEESIAQAQAAASRATTILAKDKILTAGIISHIDEELCAGCKICVNICPYEAIEFDETKKVSRVNEALCKGCGTCAAACPSGACTALGFKYEQISSQISAALV